MIDLRHEAALRWPEWVVSWEVDVQEEHSSGIGAIIRSNNGGLPVELILIVDGTSRTVGRWVLS